MLNFAEVCEGVISLHNKLSIGYDEGYKIDVSYWEIDNVYIANIEDNNHTYIQGLLFDKHQQKVPTPLLEHIEEKDSILYGIVNNKEHRLKRRVKDGHITYDLEA